MFRATIPVLRVSDSAASEVFYRDLLGFTIRFANRADATRPDPCYMGLSRDEAWLHLSSHARDGVPGAAVFVPVDDVDALHRELLGRGVAIAVGPVDQTWGNREMYVHDPDGNCLRFVQATGGA